MRGVAILPSSKDAVFCCWAGELRCQRCKTDKNKDEMYAFHFLLPPSIHKSRDSLNLSFRHSANLSIRQSLNQCAPAEPALREGLVAEQEQSGERDQAQQVEAIQRAQKCRLLVGQSGTRPTLFPQRHLGWSQRWQEIALLLSSLCVKSRIFRREMLHQTHCDEIACDAPAWS